MATIIKLEAREVLDSRGRPTVEALCRLQSGVLGRASVPSGASTGVHEALELRDHDEKRYAGLGVRTAVTNIQTEIEQEVKNKELDQKALDKVMRDLDGTENKSRLGANAILAVSLAFSRACAKEGNLELYEYLGNLSGNRSFALPQPMLNVINGGKHADSGLDFQEFMIAPVRFDSFHRKIQAGAEVISSLRKLLEAKGESVSVGDEGGFAPRLASSEKALDFLEEAIKNAGYSLDEIKIGIDAAASSFYEADAYQLRDGNKTRAEMISWYEHLIEKYPIIFLEDPLSEDDWEGFAELTERLGNKIKIVGDDLTVTNVTRIETAAEKKAVNSVLIKLNQIGTLSETIDAIMLTKQHGWVPFVSHRSGETTDTFIADLAVGLSCDYIKSGSLTRGERVCKYNRLMEIEDRLQKR